MSSIQHKGYIAQLEIDVKAGVVHGEVINTQAVLTFEADAISKVQAEFEQTIADYEDWCRHRGIDPERPFSGTLSMRIGPQLHRQVATEARHRGESINSFVVQALTASVSGEVLSSSMHLRPAQNIQPSAYTFFSTVREGEEVREIVPTGSLEYSDLKITVQ